MTRRTDKLHLVEIGYHTVAIIPAKDSIDAISRYLTRIGFDGIIAYSYSRLMTNTTTIDVGTSNTSKYHFVGISTKTIGGDFINISSQLVTCDDIYEHISSKDINNPLFMKPTIDKVRNCIGFERTPEYKLRKFCI